MREIVLDTETTGFEPDEGHRIVEIGCVEIENLLPTGRTYHAYINPERSMPEAAFNIHGLSDEFLADKPLYKDQVEDFLAFIGESRLVIHNQAFDMKFLNAENRLAGWPAIKNPVLDTIKLASDVLPAGSQLGLDRLCNYYKIDRSKRTLHGALLDSELLAEVYLHLRGGPNYNMELAVPGESKDKTRRRITASDKELDHRLILKPSETELRENKLFREANGFA
jgi:DNA polymerase III subunit epsilon